MPYSVVLLLLVFYLGCSGSTTKAVRLDTGQGEPLVHTPRRDMAPVAVSEKEFKKVVAQHAPAVPGVERPLEHARQLFGVPERSGWYRYEGRSQRLMASEPGSTRNLRLLPEDEELKRRYLLWCERTWGGGDCLRLLVDKPFLDGDAKYALAMAIAHSKVLGAMKEELARMVSPQAVVATVVGGLTMYAILLALPEPVSKGIAALMTLGAMAYLGWDTVWRLIDGWLVLMKDVDQATTFDGIYASGEKFGETMGEKAARAFVMLGTVALGNTASGMAATLPKLPGAGRAAVVAEAQLNIRWTAPALAQVESVAITAEGVTIALAPNAVAMAARDSSSSSTVGRFRAGTYGELRNAGIKDAHHVIQDAAVRDLPGYDSRAAPAVELKGPATRVGTAHYEATQVQRQAGGGSYADERRIAYEALRRAGLSHEEAQTLISRADDYFKSIGVTPSTPTRIPGNR
ncbi:SitA5 family polymorphic toxin [Hyalangium versicolor]|uniref:SitA5 family polymorphic toxin n=1 Tax=Hyalangium versicolor TaxID=2861190 RepID=UPI0040397144